MYIVEKGYGYPVEQVTGIFGTMKVALYRKFDLDVNLELWHTHVTDWRSGCPTQPGGLVDKAVAGWQLGDQRQAGQILDDN